MLEPVVQVGHILIAISTLGGIVGSAIAIYYGLKSSVQGLTFELNSLKDRFTNLEVEVKKQTDIRLVQHEHEIRLSSMKEALDVQSKRLDVLDVRQNNTQSAISELRLDRTWGTIPKPGEGK